MRRRSNIKLTMSHYIYRFEPTWHLLSRFTLSSHKGARTVPWGGGSFFAYDHQSEMNQTDFGNPNRSCEPWVYSHASYASDKIKQSSIPSHKSSHISTSYHSVPAPPLPGASLLAPVFGRRQPQTCLRYTGKSLPGLHAERSANQVRGGAPFGIVGSFKGKNFNIQWIIIIFSSRLAIGYAQVSDTLISICGYVYVFVLGKLGGQDDQVKSSEWATHWVPVKAVYHRWSPTINKHLTLTPHPLRQIQTGVLTHCSDGFYVIPKLVRSTDNLLPSDLYILYLL